MKCQEDIVAHSDVTSEPGKYPLSYLYKHNRYGCQI